MGAVDDFGATARGPIQERWLAVSGLISQPLADKPGQARPVRRAIGIAPVADRGADENACERGAPPMQTGGVCRLTRRQCEARIGANAIARLGWR